MGFWKAGHMWDLAFGALWIRNKQESRKRRASQLIYQKQFTVWFAISAQAESKSQGQLVNCLNFECVGWGTHLKFIHIIILLHSGHYANAGDIKAPAPSCLCEAHILMVEADVQEVIGNPRKGFKGGTTHSWLNTSISLPPPRNHESEELEKIQTKKIKTVGDHLTAKESCP